jgi:Protein of unknown function (DUF1236)
MGYFNLKEHVMKKLFVASIAVASLALPQMASAQSPPPQQNQSSMQSRVRNNLEKAGFTDIKITPGSLRVQARDNDGNPVLMVINPDSVTSVTEILGGQRSAAARENTTAVAATPFNLTSNERHELWQSLSMQAAKESAPAGFTAKVGDVVPSSIKVQSLPTALNSQLPTTKSYDYAMLQAELWIVDPSSNKIVDIITQ